MASPSPLLNLHVAAPIDGGFKSLNSKPQAQWLPDTNRVLWKFTELSQHSEGNGVGSLKARLELAHGPGNQGTIFTQFNCEGTTLSGVEFELLGPGYRLSLVKRRFVSGKLHILPSSFHFFSFCNYNGFLQYLLLSFTVLVLIFAKKLAMCCVFRMRTFSSCLVSGKYICDGDSDSRGRYAAPPSNVD